MKMDVKKELEDHLLKNLVLDKGITSLQPDDDLLSSEIIDSMGILQLVAFIEEKYGIEVGDEDIVPENFKTLQCMAEFIQKKKKG
jgi:acyl carrier protein